MSRLAPLVLVEPGPAATAGHWYQAAVRLCGQATQRGHAVLLVTPAGIGAAALGGLHQAGGRVINTPAGAGLAARLLWSAAAATRRVAAAAGWLARHRRFPHQLTLAARCLSEAAALRTARVHSRTEPVAVILSASEALHAAVAALSGTAHLRIVHEVYTTEDRPVRWAGRLAAPWSHRVAALAPTDTVHAELSARFPAIRVLCRPFALADAEQRLREDERDPARAALGLEPTDTVVCLVGGWWPHKDIATVASALRLLDVPVRVLVAGYPTEPVLLQDIAAIPGVQVHAQVGDLPRERIRQVYAAADATIVARRPGVGKESGLIADAAVLGVALIVSDHDPATTTLLTGRPWARMFPAGDPAALAAAIRELPHRPLPRPGTDQAAALGLRAAATALDDYLDLHHTLINRKGRR